MYVLLEDTKKEIRALVEDEEKEIHALRREDNGDTRKQMATVFMAAMLSNGASTSAAAQLRYAEVAIMSADTLLTALGE